MSEDDQINENRTEQKTSEIEFDLEDFGKEDLIHFIKYAHERNITFNEALVEILSKFCEDFESKNK